MNLNAIGGLGKEAFLSWKKDYAPSMGAALSYYTLFSIAPLLLIVISVAGFFSARRRCAARFSASWRG